MKNEQIWKLTVFGRFLSFFVGLCAVFCFAVLIWDVVSDEPPVALETKSGILSDVVLIVRNTGSEEISCSVVSAGGFFRKHVSLRPGESKELGLLDFTSTTVLGLPMKELLGSNARWFIPGPFYSWDLSAGDIVFLVVDGSSHVVSLKIPENGTGKAKNATLEYSLNEALGMVMRQYLISCGSPEFVVDPDPTRFIFAYALPLLFVSFVAVSVLDLGVYLCIAAKHCIRFVLKKQR